MLMALVVHIVCSRLGILAVALAARELDRDACRLLDVVGVLFVSVFFVAGVFQEDDEEGPEDWDTGGDYDNVDFITEGEI